MRRAREESDVEEVGKILPAIFKRQVRRENPRLVEILSPLWPRVAGRSISEHSRPITFGAGTLTLATPCSTWATELRQISEEIRAEINSFLGSPVVKKLRVRLVADVPQADADGRNLKIETVRSKLEARKSEFESAGPEPAAEASELRGEIRAELDADTARTLELSFAKYFARPARKNN